MPRHLKPEDVHYVARPLTLFEAHIWVILQAGLQPDHPQYYQLWSKFLWSRQDEVYPYMAFVDILISDFNDHQKACLDGVVQAHTLQGLNDKWDTDFFGHEPPRGMLNKKLDTWKDES